ncbi:unnamed protein product [Arabidopsis halleri]
MRNKKIKFSKRRWFKYKSVEDAIKRLFSSNLCMICYFAVWHCWKSKTLSHTCFFSFQIFQQIRPVTIWWWWWRKHGSKLEFEEWLISWDRRESWRKHKTMQHQVISNLKLFVRIRFDRKRL